MSSVWDKLVLDTVWEKDGSTILLFHGDDLEAFFHRAKSWLHASVDLCDYKMQFMADIIAERLIMLVTGKPAPNSIIGTPNLFINFRHNDDATLFKIALA